MTTYYYKYSHDFFSQRDNVYFRYYNPRLDLVFDQATISAQVDAIHLSSIYPTPFPKSSTNDTYPMAVRYADPTNGIYVVERPPFEVDVDFSVNKSFRARKVPKLFANNKMFIPWTLSLIKLDKNSLTNSYSGYEFYLYFNNKPISSLDDLIIPAWLPNISASGQVCMGEDSRQVANLLSNESEFSFLEIYNTIFNSFFSGWNSDLSPYFVDTDFSFDFRKKLVDTFPKVRWPETFSFQSSYWSYNNNSILKTILLMMSYMDYSQMSEYIDSVLSSSKASSSSGSSIGIKTLRNAITAICYNKNQKSVVDQQIANYQLNPSLYNTIDYSKTFNCFFPQVKTINFRISIADVPNTSSVSDTIVTNPYILAKLYEETLNILNSISTFNYFGGFRINLNYSDLFNNALISNEVSNV